MSTQRRAYRTIPRTKQSRWEVRFRWNRDPMGRAEMLEPGSASPARFDHGLFSGITAPLVSMICMAWAWLLSSGEPPQETSNRVATESLLSDHRSELFAGLGSRRSLLPRCRASGTTASVPRIAQRSSLSIPVFPVRTRLRHTLPHAPAARPGECWAERHDGKRDLYFQHAA